MKATTPATKTPRDWVVVIDGQHAAGTATYLGELDRGVRQGVKKLANATRFTRVGARRVLADYPSAVAEGNAYSVQLTRSDLTGAPRNHATKNKAQLDREVAEFIAARGESALPSSEPRAVRDAAKLRELWMKHVSLDAHTIDLDRLYDVVRRSVKAAKTLLATGRPEASRALLTELRNDLSEVGRLKKRRRA
jgi:hypothetical protein